MNLRRTASVAAATFALLLTLTACFAIPGLPRPGGGNGNPGGGAGAELVGTTWSGTDSDGDFWAFEFQSDGTVGMTYETDTYDDPADVWNLDGSTLNISLAFTEGTYELTGPYTGGESIDLDGTWPGGTFTVTITKQ